MPKVVQEIKPKKETIKSRNIYTHTIYKSSEVYNANKLGIDKRIK